MKQQVDKIDNETKTLGYTVIDGDESKYSSFVAELHFSPTEDNNKTEATWTVKYEPVGEAGPPENALKMVIITLKTFEKAALQKRVVRHTRVLEAPVDTIWNILMHEDVILPKIIPHIIFSYEFLEGNGEAGSIRLLKLGHGTVPYFPITTLYYRTLYKSPPPLTEQTVNSFTISSNVSLSYF